MKNSNRYLIKEPKIPRFESFLDFESCKVYTKGSCYFAKESNNNNNNNTKATGIGVFYGSGDSRNISRRLEGQFQSRNRAELAAVIAALTQAKIDQPFELYIYTGSVYVIGCMINYINESKIKESSANYDLILKMTNRLWELDQLSVLVCFHKIKSHSGIYGNDQAHILSKKGAKWV